MTDTKLVVFSKGKPGREAEYEGWYRTRHLGDVKKVPGVEDGGLYGLTAPDPNARWGVLGA